MASEKRRQKRLQKRENKREKKRTEARTSKQPQNIREWMRAAARWPVRETRASPLNEDALVTVVVARNGLLHIYTQDTPFPQGERIYAPVRKHGQVIGNPISTPGWRINGT